MKAFYENRVPIQDDDVHSAVDALIRSKNREMSPVAYQLFSEAWPVAEVVAALCEACWDNPADCIEAISSSPTLLCSPREIQTVAAYHYRMQVGGAERVAATLANIWHDRGLRVVFFADEPREASAYELPGDVVWITLPDSSNMTREAYEERARMIEDAVQTYHIDAFVHHQWWNKLIAWDMLLLKTLNVPFCVFCHNIYEVLFLDANPKEFDCSRLFRYADGLVTLSEADLEFWQHFNPRVWQTHNPATIEPDSTCISSLNGKNIVWVGRLSSWDKQPQEAIQIAARAIARDPEITLTIVGSTSDKVFFKELRRLVRDLGIQDKVSFVGEHADPSSFFEHASLLLLTSRLDGWCLVLAEAKAFGLPCVMYDMPYLTLAKDKRGIVSVPQGDRDGAAQAVVDLLANYSQRKELGRQAFDHMTEIANFNLGIFWDNVFCELGKGSVKRTGFETDDAQWNLLLDGIKESVRKASDPGIRAYAKRKGSDIAQAFLRHFRK